MDTLTNINVFRQVVESGSFLGAAERLGLSTAMVSKHVMAIEKLLRVRLLNRNSHSCASPSRADSISRGAQRHSSGSAEDRA
jgi:DNA-binding transcriptional LysR family regulator